MQPLADLLVPLLRRSGVQVVLSGHEHNFQHHHRDGVDYLITGASGKLREDPPDRLVEAGNRSWGAEGHFLIVDVEPRRLVVHPVTDVGEDGRFAYLRRQTPDGHAVSGQIVIERRGEHGYPRDR